ncbi:hypothetical protein ACO0K9_02180 [Undibacterium sp. Ji50W]|uniref:hypothetical protein n=1 Tax=Undibacterium sp. Ji50W TaxID=3413041 RepID=UPI003BF232AE
MFSKSDLDQIDINIFGLHRYRGLYFVTYRQDAFAVPDSEENIYISRAPKYPGDNGIRFWLAAEMSKGEKLYGPYLQEAEFRPIPEEKFNGLVAEQCFHLILKPQLPLNQSGQFVGALLMYSMETEFIVDLFAEYEDEYIHFYWHTTA